MTDRTRDARAKRTRTPEPRNPELENLFLQVLDPRLPKTFATMHVHEQVGGIIKVHWHGAPNLAEIDATALNGVSAQPDDLALCVNINERWYVLGTIAAEDAPQVTVGYALEAHQHTVPGADVLMLGHNTSIDDSADEVGSTFVTTNTTIPAGVDRATALGSYHHSLRSRCVAIGHWVTNAIRSIAIGTGANASGAGSIVIGDNGHAGGEKSIVIGDGATAQAGVRSIVLGANGHADGNSDDCWIWANRLVLRPSGGTLSKGIFFMQDGAGNWQSIQINADATLNVSGRTVGGTVRQQFPNNKQVASGGPYNFRNRPIVDAANVLVALPSGHALHDTGQRFDLNSNNWAVVYSHTYGWGYIVSSAMI